MRVVDRIRAHIHEAECGGTSAFKAALREYGIDSFQVDTIFEGLTENEAIQREKELIVKYRTYIGFDDCMGYNSTLGGDGVHSVTDEHNKINQYSADGNLIRTYNSLREAEDLTGVNRVGIANACDGIKISAGGYQWRRVRDVDSVKIEPQLCGMDRIIRKVSQFTLDGDFIATFDSIQEAADAVGCYSSQIVKVCRGEHKSTKGFLWKYYENGDECRKLNITRNSTIKREVVQLDSNMNIVATYESIAQASKIVNIPKTTISSAIKDGRLCRGYYWKSKQDYKHKRMVAKCNDNGQILEVYESMMSASKETGVSRANILKCCKNKQNRAGGFMWKYI